MQLVTIVLFLSGFYPLVRAWRANRHTSLLHAILWAHVAWLSWGIALLAGEPYRAGFDPWRYLALCLTGAAGIAVLGARRPQVGAWNFVVLGLLTVMLLPLGEQVFLGTPAVSGLRVLFLAATLAVAILNYLPTSLLVVALAFGAICGAEGLMLFGDYSPSEPFVLGVLHFGLPATIWLAFWRWRRPLKSASELDRLWLNFRDRFGLFWAQRVREQFNRSAAHALLPGSLFWHGWEGGGQVATEEQTRELLELLKALLKRFENV